MDYKYKLSQKVDDKDLLNLIWENFNTASDYKETNIMSKVRLWRDYTDRKPYGNEVDGRSKYIDTIIRDYMYTIVTSIIEPITNSKDTVKLFPNTGNIDDILNIQKTEKLINYQFNFKTNKFTKFDEILKLFTIDGYCTTKVFWDMETKKTYTKNLLMPDEISEYKHITRDEFSFLSNTYQQQDENIMPENLIEHDDDTISVDFVKEEIIRENPNFKIVPLENIFWSPNTTKMSYIDYDCDYVIETAVMTESEIRYRLKSDDAYRSFTDDEIGEMLRTTSIVSPQDDTKDGDISLSDYYNNLVKTFPDIQKGSYIVLDYFGFIDIDKDGFDEMVHIEVLGDKIIKLELNPYESNMIPYNVAIFEKKPLSMKTDSIASLLSEIQKLKTGIMRNIVDSLGYRTLRNYFVKRKSLSPANVSKFQKRIPGQLVEVDLQRGENIRDVIEEMKVSDLPREYFDFLSVLEQKAQETTGITAYTQGLDSKSLNKTATGVSILTNMSMKKIWKISETVSSGIIENTTKAFMILNKMFLDEGYYIDMTNDETASINKDEININADVVVDLATKGLEGEKTNQIIQFMSYATPYLESGLITPDEMKGLFTKLAEDWGLKETAIKISQQPQEQLQGQGQSQMMQQQEQQELPPIDENVIMQQIASMQGQ